MDNQQFFSACVTHLRKQGRPAKDTLSGNCFYETKVGDLVLCCAVGGVMPPGLRALVKEAGLNSAGFDSLLGDRSAPPAVLAFFDGVDEMLGNAMQEIHDTKPPGLWEESFKKVAEDWHLVLEVAS